ncbi:hypothetical protein [Streptomyces diastaticus]|uniref:hypothetical protein n=1 Tax=Streptomyces diastaticus TaxID=1956 RepID=UPI0036C5AFDF
MADTRIQTRVEEDLADWLTERDLRMHTGSHHIQAKLELGMWRRALAAELRRIRLTLNQANLIASVLSGTVMTPEIVGSAPAVLMEVGDAFHLARETPLPGEAPYGETWSVDEDALLHYLRTLGPTADHALFDAVSRWWKAGEPGTVEGWANVGLTVVPDAPAAEHDEA